MHEGKPHIVFYARGKASHCVLNIWFVGWLGSHTGRIYAGATPRQHHPIYGCMASTAVPAPALIWLPRMNVQTPDLMDKVSVPTVRDRWCYGWVAGIYCISGREAGRVWYSAGAMLGFLHSGETCSNDLLLNHAKYKPSGIMWWYLQEQGKHKTRAISGVQTLSSFFFKCKNCKFWNFWNFWKKMKIWDFFVAWIPWNFLLHGFHGIFVLHGCPFFPNGLYKIPYKILSL